MNKSIIKRKPILILVVVIQMPLSYKKLIVAIIIIYALKKRIVRNNTINVNSKLIRVAVRPITMLVPKTKWCLKISQIKKYKIAIIHFYLLKERRLRSTKKEVQIILKLFKMINYSINVKVNTKDNWIFPSWTN